MPEICITNGTILTMDQKGTVIKNGALYIKGERITYCGPKDGQNMPNSGQAKELDAKGGLILPGFINGHTHAAMTLMRGLADDLPLQTWLTDHIFPAERKLTGEAVYWGTMLACAEMIKNGVTSFGDMYLFAHKVAQAAEVAGMRAVVGEVIYDFPSPSYGDIKNGLAWTEELVKKYKDHPQVTGAVMPHALYTCSPSLLEDAGQICADLGADMNIHLAENKAETEEVLTKYGRRPLAHLDALGLVNEKLWIDHGVDLNADEIERMAEAGVRVALCAESNMKLASGVAPFTAMAQAGVIMGLGTDGCASNNDLDLLGEMDSFAKVHKMMENDPTAAPAWDVVALATSGGGRAFGRDDLGVIREGALADVIVIDTNQPHLTPMYNPYSHLVYAARGSDVIHTVCHGKVLMKDRALLSLDEAEVMAKATEQAAKLGLF